MVTDDPGTPPNGHWEINIGALGALTSQQTLFQAPYFDINYGWGDRTQLKVETGWVILHDGTYGFKNGADTILIGVKERFLDEDKAGVAVSTYPQFQFHHFFSSKDPELTTPGNQILLPLELSKNLGNWAINPEVGYLWGSDVSSQIFYGIVLAFEKLSPWEPLAEIHLNTLLDGTGSTTLLNAGFRYTFNSKMNLLGALGRTVTQPQDQAQEWNTYLALQLEL
jgi:hypothetical protein